MKMKTISNRIRILIFLMAPGNKKVLVDSLINGRRHPTQKHRATHSGPYFPCEGKT